MPLNGVNAQLGLPFSTRPDAGLDQGATAGGPSNNWSCNPAHKVDAGTTITGMMEL